MSKEKSQKVRGETPVFNAASPGFVYTVMVSALTVLALAGVQFPDNPADIAADLSNLLSTSGFWALIGVAVSSVAFPIYNAWKKGDLSFKGIFSNTLTWVAIAVLVFYGVALIGLNFPAGTGEQIVYAVFAKDWSALVSILVTTVLPAIVRFIKEKNAKA